MNRPDTIHVYVELAETTVHAGTLRVALQRGQERSGFAYSDAWLKHPLAYQLDPEIPLHPGLQYPGPGKALFNTFSDAAPDRWGRYLVVRAEKRAAEREKRSRRQLFEADYLLGVYDLNRMGALRFRAVAPDGSESPFLAHDGPEIPPLVDLRRLQDSVARVEAHRERDEDLALLLAPGASLGGARPKAVVQGPQGQMMIAKFERDKDEWPVIRWEALMLRLAEDAGIRVPSFTLEVIDGKAALLMDRFDRRGERRIPFASALTLVGASDGDERSYLDIAEAILQFAGNADEDLKQLWRRMVFNVLVSNTDDHLRNHGFLYEFGHGWYLSPAYDMNPVPAEVGPRVMSLALDEHGDRTGNLEIALEEAEYYGIDSQEAITIAQEVAESVARWRDLAHLFGLKGNDLNHMESAFEHGDIELALDGSLQRTPGLR